MSESYKIYNDGLHFITMTVVGWLDVFTRREYQDVLIESFIYCQKNKNLKLYCYCIMPSHIHFIANSENGNLSEILKDLKSYTAKNIIKAIEENIQESRKELLLQQFRYYGTNSPQKQTMQFWQHHNHAFYLYSNEMIEQKMNYIHQNPVKEGFVCEPQDWRLSSANINSPLKMEAI